MRAARAAEAAAIVFAVSLARFELLPLLRLPADSPALVVLDGALPALAHLLVFPVVAGFPAPGWARAAGYGWLVVDICTEVLAVNGVPGTIYLPLRYGGHVSAALWIAAASWQAPSVARWVGVLLALDLGLYSFLAPWASFVWLAPSSLMLVIWLVLVGRRCARGYLHDERRRGAPHVADRRTTPDTVLVSGHVRTAGTRSACEAV